MVKSLLQRRFFSETWKGGMVKALDECRPIVRCPIPELMELRDRGLHSLSTCWSLHDVEGGGRGSLRTSLRRADPRAFEVEQRPCRRPTFLVIKGARSWKSSTPEAAIPTLGGVDPRDHPDV